VGARVHPGPEVASNGAASPVLEVARGVVSPWVIHAPRTCHTRAGTLIAWGTSKPDAKVQFAAIAEMPVKDSALKHVTARARDARSSTLDSGVDQAHLL
jgi:hypothetical protein